MQFEFGTATQVIFGCGTLTRAGEIASQYGKRALVVTGRNTLRAVRDYPNNYIAINLTVRGTACSITWA